MKVYVVLDDSKACYDAGGIYCEVFRTMEAAEEYLSKYGSYDRQDFQILEEEI